MQKIFINSGKAEEELFKSAFILTDSNLDRIYGPLLPENRFVIKAGEENKNLRVVEDIASAMLRLGVKKGDRAAAFGGGVVGDILGFTASVYMRGISWSFVPTSLLAMADSSIGGKTAVNVGLIKNAVGSFSMPDTFIETKYLRTLPAREYESGMGEIVKTALLNEELFEFMHGKFDEQKAIEKCVKIKSDIVEKDMFDHGARRALNIGHTVGHAVEMLTGLSHGKSVLIGLRLEMLMMRDLIDPNFFYEAHSFLSGYIGEIPFIDVDDVTAIARSDKKNDEGISIMFAHKIGDVREAKLDCNEFRRLLKEAM